MTSPPPHTTTYWRTSPFFLQLLNKRLLSPYYVPDAVNARENKTDAASVTAYSVVDSRDHKISINKMVIPGMCFKGNKQEAESK